MILPIRKVPNELLNKPCESISDFTDEIKQLGRDMLETMIHNEGLGLAAPQVGVLKRIVVVTIKGTPTIMYNPTIIAKSPKKEASNEGCLSFEKGVEYKVKRPAAVKVKYRNEHGKMTYAYLQGLDARVFCHEFDHLLGVTMNAIGELVE